MSVSAPQSPTAFATTGTAALAQGQIAYRDSGSGPTIVFLHGAFVDGTLWRKVVPELEDGFRCVVPDLPLGSHRRPIDPDADLSPPGLAKLIAAFLAELELDDVTLIGNDTGGALCQLAVTRHPERIGRLVLTPCDAYEHFPPPAFRYLQVLARIPGPSVGTCSSPDTSGRNTRRSTGPRAIHLRNQ